MYLVKYLVNEGNNYAGGTVERWTVETDLSKCFRHVPVEIHIIAIKQTLTPQQISSARSALKQQEAEANRTSRIARLEEELALLRT